MDDVQLLVRGSAAQGTTDAQGHFTLAGLPAGTFTLEVRLLGFAPTRVIVDLASHRTTTVTVTLDKKVAVLNEVHRRSSGATGAGQWSSGREHSLGPAAAADA